MQCRRRHSIIVDSATPDGLAQFEMTLLIFERGVLILATGPCLFIIFVNKPCPIVLTIGIDRESLN
jgi:hypothetical protein